ncbi:hypothetical protein E2C01_049634 [Portunus trituberculatus]|uniref:Uncharacterized protein n=1 Tax=Portunus trituberculatus TaxID=210409 RepID=A0A5B7G647_PORTR|nr:hypothetical protein [Portunus trituberculatus]
MRATRDSTATTTTTAAITTTTTTTTTTITTTTNEQKGRGWRGKGVVGVARGCASYCPRHLCGSPGLSRRHGESPIVETRVNITITTTITTTTHHHQ